MLTIKQRAARAAKRKNKKISQSYQTFDEMQYALGMKYREIARAEMPADLWQDYEDRYQSIFGKRDLYGQAVFLADWWHCALRDNGSAWLQNNCPNSQWHDEEYYRRRGECPTCGRYLTPLAPDRL
ncbi:MAG: hypothetical protein WHV44_00145 [Anaerolineales bacterium]